mgnify:CR=1 FL=1
MALQPHRVDGQIWIDKNSPNRLKYHINEQDYTVEVSSNYNIENIGPVTEEVKTVKFAAGTLVKLNEKGYIEPALFPDDLENILGVLMNNVRVTQNDKEERIYTNAIVSRSGYLTIDYMNIDPSYISSSYAHSFFDESENENDLECKNGEPLHFKKGSPVYWFIGRYKKEEETYTFINPKYINAQNEYARAGKLTFATPVGYPSDPIDPSLNVGYNNLPRVGTVANYEVKDGKITKVMIHVNFSKFDSSLEWTWPRKHVPDFIQENISYGFDKPNIDIKNNEQQDSILTIRHGLLQQPDNNAKPKCLCEILASEKHEGNESEEYRVTASISQNTSENNTSITVNTYKPMFYRVFGTVSYAFDEE